MTRGNGMAAARAAWKHGKPKGRPTDAVLADWRRKVMEGMVKLQSREEIALAVGCSVAFVAKQERGILKDWAYLDRDRTEEQRAKQLRGLEWALSELVKQRRDGDVTIGLLAELRNNIMDQAKLTGTIAVPPPVTNINNQNGPVTFNYINRLPEPATWQEVQPSALIEGK